MNKWKIILLVQLAISLLITSCVRKPPAKEWNRFFPLKEGNQWVYETELTIPNGRTNVELTHKVTGITEIGGKQCFVYEIHGLGNWLRKEYFEISSNALISHKWIMKVSGGQMTATLDPPEPILSFPLEVGKSWTWKGTITGNFKGDFKFSVTGEENLQVPAGKFKALKIEMEGAASDGSKVNSSRWYAEGVGIIKEDSYAQVGAGTNTALSLLKLYTVDGTTVPEK